MSTEDSFRIAAIPNTKMTPVDFTLRLLTEEDIGEVLALQRRHLINRYGRSYPQLPQYLSFDQLFNRLQSPRSFAFVADTVQRKIAACFFVSPANEVSECLFCFNRNADSPVGHNLIVDPYYRGYGLAAAIMRESIRHIRQNSSKEESLMLQIQANNTKAIRAALAVRLEMVDYDRQCCDPKNPKLLFKRRVDTVGNSDTDYGCSMTRDCIIIDTTRPHSEILQLLRDGAVGVGCMTLPDHRKLLVFANS